MGKPLNPVAMASRDQTPPTQGSSSASTDPPATPGPNTTTMPAPVTPRGRQRTLPPKTPGTRNSPFTARVPRTPSNFTPGGTVKACADVESLYDIVRVHTAKCTECDKRNTDIMRRCPGCTFQICTPCYERREKEGKGLRHGIMQTPGTGRVPGSETTRAVRRRPLGVSTTPSGSGSIGMKGEVKKEDEGVKKEGKSIKAEGQPVVGKQREKVRPTMKSSGKKRPIRKKPQVEDSASEESSDDDFSPEPSPTPSKRRRGEPAFESLLTSTTTPVKRPTRKPSATTTAPAYRAPSSSQSESTIDPLKSTGLRPSEVNGDTLLNMFANQGYDEPLLGRRMPVVTNPVIEIPELIKRGLKRRSSPEEIQPNFRVHAFKPMQEKSLEHMAAQRQQVEEDAYPYTVRAFFEKEAAKYRDDVTMDEDENESLFSAMREEARVWGKQTHAKLDFTTQNMVREGLNMRLDKIDGAYKTELAELMDECAARKMKEFQDSAPHVPERLFVQR